MSLSEIEKVHEKAKHIHSSVDFHFYREREDSIENYYERFGRWQKHVMELGALNADDDIRKILLLHKYNLDYGTLYLHYYAFLPAVELLAS